jgi:hypothetical protein
MPWEKHLKTEQEILDEITAGLKFLVERCPNEFAPLVAMRTWSAFDQAIWLWLDTLVYRRMERLSSSTSLATDRQMKLLASLGADMNQWRMRPASEVGAEITRLQLAEIAARVSDDGDDDANDDLDDENEGRVFTAVRVEEQGMSEQASVANDCGRKFPLIVRSSPRALVSLLIWRVIGLALALVVIALIATYGFAEQTSTPKTSFLIITLCLWGLAFGVEAARAYLRFRRIANTVYRIFPNRIEASSFTFAFMGVQNRTAGLGQLRTIEAHSNSLLDVWFFNCGCVSLTVSGDESDFWLDNIHNPSEVRELISGVAFGHRGGAARGEVLAAE